MGSVKDYFSGLFHGVSSLVKGMQVTGKEFVTPKITERYPEKPAPVAPRFRASLRLIYDQEGRHRCIACGTCERVCPNGTIALTTDMVDTWKGTKKKHLVDYRYDLGSCTFCQLCATNCPTNALDFSNDFEQAVFTRGKLVKKLNYLPDKPEPEPTAEERAKYEAEKAAKIAAAKAAAAAKAKAAAEGAAAPAPAKKEITPEMAAKIAAAKAKAAQMMAGKAKAAEAAADKAEAAAEAADKKVEELIKPGPQDVNKPIPPLEPGCAPGADGPDAKA